MSRVVVVGCGNVGATFAYTALLRGMFREIVLIDQNHDKARGDALDLNHGMPLAHPARIWAGDYADCTDADIIAIAAGVGQRPGESRLDLLKRNVEVLRAILTQIDRYTRRAILLVATNPVDVLSYAAWKLSGLPAGRVLGSGTLLDTARFRFLLGRQLNMDPRSIHAYIVGEHGDTELPAWSSASAGGVPLTLLPARLGLDDTARQDIFAQTRSAAAEIIQAKGATYYAIALAMHRICQAILGDEDAVLPVSTLLSNYHGISGVYLGVPAVVGRDGVKDVLPVPLSDAELAGLRRSAEVIGGLAGGLAFCGQVSSGIGGSFVSPFVEDI